MRLRQGPNHAREPSLELQLLPLFQLVDRPHRSDELHGHGFGRLFVDHVDAASDRDGAMARAVATPTKELTTSMVGSR